MSSDLIRRYFAAFRGDDWSAFEAFLADGFTFTSPHDDHIDKAGFFERCWPHRHLLRSVELEQIFVQGDELFVRYRAERADGVTFRNVEFMRLDNGKVRAVEVYFGSE